MTATLAPRRLRLGDLGRLAAVGLRTRKLRAALSALGIAIGVAAIVAVLGLSASSQAGLLAEIDLLGTNLLNARMKRAAGLLHDIDTTGTGALASRMCHGNRLRNWGEGHPNSRHGGLDVCSSFSRIPTYQGILVLEHSSYIVDRLRFAEWPRVGLWPFRKQGVQQ